LEAAQFVAELCRQKGGEVEMEQESVHGEGQANVIARWGGEASDQELILQAHLDTADPGNFTQWTQTQSNPFNGTIYDGRLFGLGAANAKLDFLCKLEAIKPTVNSQLKRPVVIVGTYGANTGMSGALKLVRRKKILGRRAIVGAPTNLRLATGGLGLAEVELSVPFTQEEAEYRENHDQMESGSTQSKIFTSKNPGSAALEENAIIKMLEYLVQLPQGIAVMDLDGGRHHNTAPASAVLEIDVVAGFRDTIVPKLQRVLQVLRQLEVELSRVEDKRFQPSHPVINVGVIRTFPDQVRLLGNCRLPPAVSQEQYQVWMERLAVDCAAIGAQFRIRDYRPGFIVQANSTFLNQVQQLVRGLGLDADPDPNLTCTEASIFSRLGIECVLFGPGQSVGGSQGPNESVKVENLSRAIEMYKKVIESYCL